MRIANVGGRAALITSDGCVDVAEASGGSFGPDPMSVWEHWDDFTAWAATAPLDGGNPYDPEDVGIPVPRPRQIIAIGANYKDHAEEAGIPAPEHLIVFTKFASSLTDPNATVELPSDDVDYETELVVVIGRGGHRIPEAEAWTHVAGIAVGQDYSERTVQRRPPVPQFSLGKSYPDFSPFGPVVVTPDEFPDRESIRFSSTLDRPGEETLVLQTGDSANLFFSVPEMIRDLSYVLTLFPGDIIFTGTPAGVGLSRDLMMRPGYRVTSTLDGFGSFTNEFVAGS